MKMNFRNIVLVTCLALFAFEHVNCDFKSGGPYRLSPIVRRIINSTFAPAAIGPYSQAVQVGDTLYISGNIGLNVNGSLVPGGIIAEATQGNICFVTILRILSIVEIIIYK